MTEQELDALEIINDPTPNTEFPLLIDISDDFLKTLLNDYPLINAPDSEGDGGGECDDGRPNTGMLYPRG